MKSIVIKPGDENDFWTHDCKRIVQIMEDRGFQCTVKQAKELWEKFSDSMAAGWMRLPDEDDHVFSNISYYFEEGAEV